MTYLLLAIGLVLLAIGGDTLVDGAVGLARRMGVSTLLIGLTLVGFGTSTPELVSSLTAVFQGSSGIAVGNVVGSNIANILLVLGAAALIAPVKVDAKSFHRDGVFLMGATILLLVAMMTGQINRVFASVLVLVLVVYVTYSYISDKRAQANKKQKKKTQDAIADAPVAPMSVSLIKAVGGIALTILGARLLVDNAIVLARAWGVSEAIIGLTVVAVGTSLPELATSVMSSLRGHNDVAFGNVVGSNIYNALFILGVTALFAPVAVPGSMGFDALLMIAVTLLMVIIALWRRCFSRGVGFIFLAAYAVYTAYLYLGSAV